MKIYKRAAALALALMLAAAPVLADRAPAKSDVPPEKIETQAEGTFEMYDLTFPEDMPLEARNFVLFARNEFETTGNVRLPKCNQYTKWYYQDKREIGWCSVFQIYCAYHTGMRLIRFKQGVDVAEGECITAMEGRVGQVAEAFREHGRWLDAKEGAVPKPGYLVIYGVRGSTPYTHVAIVESVTDKGDGLYELTTVEGNLGSVVRRINYRYNAAPKDKFRNMSVVPEGEITRQNCQYKLQKNDWYVTGFCATW